MRCKWGQGSGVILVNIPVENAGPVNLEQAGGGDCFLPGAAGTASVGGVAP